MVNLSVVSVIWQAVPWGKKRGILCVEGFAIENILVSVMFELPQEFLSSVLLCA